LDVVPPSELRGLRRTDTLHFFASGERSQKKEKRIKGRVEGDLVENNNFYGKEAGWVRKYRPPLRFTRLGHGWGGVKKRGKRPPFEARYPKRIRGIQGITEKKNHLTTHRRKRKAFGQADRSNQ